uniref:receptor kinase-like protein Xa21 n=1 Tax=Erigeron canadensis TaxID=72917 RepID=UPI001CB91B9D|nr:receptor kinase-like protein Xa21 [Erigeron canadensis]
MSLGFNNFGSGESDEMDFINTLSNCSKLEILDVGGNNLRGILPESLAKFSAKLYFLRLSSNNILGNLPSSLGNLSGLTTLDLSYNQFMGTIPASFDRLQNLRRLELKNNNLAGDIPNTLGNLSSLIELHMGMNHLNGTIPSSLGNCKKLIGLTLEQNFLRGRIPKNLFGLASLSISLNLGSNQLSGQLPFEIGNDLKNLNELILAENLLSGKLPSSIGSCTSLQNLNIGRNFFHGSLPPSMVSLRALQNLDVSFNNFTGQIPSFLEILPLQSLNISFNDFEGQVSSKGVFLNASELIIKGNNRLCGGIPELLLPKCSPNHSKGTKRLSLSVILVISVVPVLFCAAAVLVYLFYWRKMKDRDADDTSHNIDEMPPVKVSYKKLYNATGGFSPNNVIGKGSFASVYRGNLDLDGGIVAVKVLNLCQKGGSKSFISECKALRNARHRNLVKVITCCSGSDFEGNEFKALVYDFMPNGSLDRWLHSSHVAQNLQNDLPLLSLLQRVSIALDVAYALDYLHNHNGRTIVHCDLKPSNILLDKDMVAHVGDFGLSKILQPEHVNKYDNSSTGIRGTIGYAAPAMTGPRKRVGQTKKSTLSICCRFVTFSEDIISSQKDFVTIAHFSSSVTAEYGFGGKVSTSGDIYSYGILLLEMLTTKRPTDPIFKEEINLHSYARTEMRDHLLDIVDPILLKNDFGNHVPSANKNGEELLSVRNEACLRQVIELGVACSMGLPQHRMDIDGVIQELHLVKEVLLSNSTG